MCAYIHTYTHTRTYIYTYAYTHTYCWFQRHKRPPYVIFLAGVRAKEYVYIHTHTHTYIHRNMHTCNISTGAYMQHIHTYMQHIHSCIHATHSQVHQAEADDEELRRTDGKMLEIIVQNDHIVCLSPTSESGGPEWTQVVDQCFAKSAGALVDAGALLAGISNRKIAGEILSRMSEACPYRGVIFFDVRACSWLIRARDGQEWSKSASPIPERECFALFDEIRCRGADLKLAHNTVAMVTVGTRMCKDKGGHKDV
jgi:hypothetical protein